MSDSDKKEKYGEDYSYITEAINYILLAADCPQKFHAYIYCLIGIADGNPNFEASDLEVAARAKGNLASGKKSATKEWAKDKRKDFMEWQREHKLMFVAIKSGKRTQDKYIKSTYDFHLLKYAEQVKNEAQANEVKYKVGRSVAIQQAANGLIHKLRLESKNLPKAKDNWVSPSVEVLSRIRTARTSLEVAASLLKQHDFQLDRSQEGLIKEIEGYITSIKDRGYVDDILDTIIFTRDIEDGEDIYSE